MRKIHFFALVFLLGFLQVRAQENILGIQQDSISILTNRTDTIVCTSIAEAMKIYNDKKFQLETIRKTKEVPRIHIVNFPKEIKTTSVTNKKTLFTSAVLAAVLRANNDIILERNEIIRMSQLDVLTPNDSVLLVEFFEKYYANSFEELIKKADGLPPSLVIAQAIDESGWGTSYFSLNANSIFGLKAPRSATGQTIKSPSSSFSTFVFPNLEEGIKEYIMNMNRHIAYELMRDIRYAKRMKGEDVTGKDLLSGIKRYSTRGSAYLSTISKFITMYKLEEFDACQVIGTDVLFIKF